MYVKKLKFYNYRGFKNTEINFHESINVIYGVNGSGKSTIIDALASIFTLLKKNKTGVPSNTTLIPSDFFNDPNNRCSIEIEVETDGHIKHLCLQKPNPLDTPDTKTSVELGHQEAVKYIDLFQRGNSLADGTFLDGDLEYFKSLSGNHVLLRPGHVRPVATQAKQNGSRLTIELSQSAPFAVMKGIPDVEQLRGQFEELEAAEQQRRLENEENYRDTKLEQVRSALKLLDRQYGLIKIDRTIKGKPFVVEKKGRFLKYPSQLSAGEAGIIAILCYLAFHENQSDGEVFPILIDEIDNSLHPRWQSKIVSNLAKHFTKRQFILTSHSPFVWSELKRENIVHLQFDDEGNIFAEQPSYAKGGGIDSIVTEFFDLDLYGATKEKIDAVERLINEKNFKEANDEIRTIKETLGPLPVLARLQTKIRFLS